MDVQKVGDELHVQSVLTGRVAQRADNLTRRASSALDLSALRQPSPFLRITAKTAPPNSCCSVPSSALTKGLSL